MDKKFTPAERIQQLNEIDKDIAQILCSAGQAIQALTNSPLQSLPEGLTADSSENNLELRKKAFKAASSQYFALLSSISVRLRRQVYALEEAGIIRPEPPGASKLGDAGAVSSGINPLETSWLNTRKDSVEKDKEAELWAEASKFVSKLVAKREEKDSPASATGDNGKDGEDGKDTMEID
ncbi:hypothetical protein FQN57_000474 [Myotisia sp. PD_48]|nr:hypothetical protein FQN57_000474 [Myotisia sp. PD_48]